MTIALVSPAAAESSSEAGTLGSACHTFRDGGGHIVLCYDWHWDGNDYDGSWWVSGPSDLPGGAYLKRKENDDGIWVSSRWSGSYNDRDTIYFKVCDNMTGGCDVW
ncbi:hypothetical protein ILP97_00010 [Amycolatopsis sp. H6(2020)]|nr:hypothetical protein [Amycolatopsis sp. H6(2020)]